MVCTYCMYIYVRMYVCIYCECMCMYIMYVCGHNNFYTHTYVCVYNVTSYAYTGEHQYDDGAQ